MMIRELSSSVVACVLIAACASAPSGPSGGTRDSCLDVLMTTDDGRLARWVLDQDGTMHFAGGRAAHSGAWSWTGPGDPAEVAKINSVVDGWQQRMLTGDGDNHVTWHVSMDGGETVMVRGASAAMQRMWLALNTAGRARLQADLDRVPEGDLDRYMRDRAAAAQGEE